MFNFNRPLKKRYIGRVPKMNYDYHSISFGVKELRAYTFNEETGEFKYRPRDNFYIFPSFSFRVAKTSGIVVFGVLYIWNIIFVTIDRVFFGIKRY